MRLQTFPVLLAALALGCGGSGGTGPSVGPDQVLIQGFAFNPTPRTIAVGTTVTWINKDGTAHTTTNNAADAWDSGSMGANASFAHTFDTPGTFQYSCTIHPNMHGVIIVN